MRKSTVNQAGADQAATDQLDRAVEASELLEIYGAMLTERQRECVRLHYCEDLSFGEIGKIFNISRQAVHDAVRHALNTLNDYEDKLKLLVGGADGRKDNENIKLAAQNLEQLLESVRKQGVIYNTRPLQDDLREILNCLQQELNA